MTSTISRISAAIALLLYVVVAISVTSNAQSAPVGPSASSTASTAPVSPKMAFAFEATDLAGDSHALAEYLESGKFVILEWFNPDCPYVKKYHAPGGTNTSFDEALAFAREQDFVWLMVNSNAPGKQGSGVEHNQQAVEAYGIDVPLILDETGEIGQAYGATSTPQIFLINPAGHILYNGGIDDTKLDTDVPGVNYVINAVKQAKTGKAVDPATTPHPGCSVKYPDAK